MYIIVLLLHIISHISVFCVKQNVSFFKNVECNKGFFLDTTGNCRNHLTCEEMKSDLEFIKNLPGGYVKKMSLVQWRDMELVYSTPRSFLLIDDFAHGMQMMDSLQDSEYLVKVVGLCYEPNQILTKYYKHGSANKLQDVLQNKGLSDLRESKIRLQLSLDYLEIINFLHNSPIGCRVMCDSNDLEKTTSQFLISDNFHLVVSDLDALPEVNSSGGELIKCGHRELFGSFVAPEQLWPFSQIEFDDVQMPAYDEKTDIWKIPDVLYYLLGNTFLSDRIKFMLFDLLKTCKSFVAKDRPNSKEIIEAFKFYKTLIFKELDRVHSGDEL